MKTLQDISITAGRIRPKFCRRVVSSKLTSLHVFVFAVVVCCTVNRSAASFPRGSNGSHEHFKRRLHQLLHFVELRAEFSLAAYMHDCLSIVRSSFLEKCFAVEISCGNLDSGSRASLATRWVHFVVRGAPVSNDALSIIPIVLGYYLSVAIVACRLQVVIAVGW